MNALDASRWATVALPSRQRQKAADRLPTKWATPEYTTPACPRPDLWTSDPAAPRFRRVAGPLPAPLPDEDNPRSPDQPRLSARPAWCVMGDGRRNWWCSAASEITQGAFRRFPDWPPGSAGDGHPLWRSPPWASWPWRADAPRFPRPRPDPHPAQLCPINRPARIDSQVRSSCPASWIRRERCCVPAVNLVSYQLDEELIETGNPRWRDLPPLVDEL